MEIIEVILKKLLGWWWRNRAAGLVRRTAAGGSMKESVRLNEVIPGRPPDWTSQEPWRTQDITDKETESWTRKSSHLHWQSFWRFWRRKGNKEGVWKRLSRSWRLFWKPWRITSKGRIGRDGQGSKVKRGRSYGDHRGHPEKAARLVMKKQCSREGKRVTAGGGMEEIVMLNKVIEDKPPDGLRQEPGITQNLTDKETEAWMQSSELF